MVALFAPFGLDVRAADVPVNRQTPIEELLAAAAETEQGFDAVFGALLADVPRPDDVESRTLTITGVDGNAITLHVDRPAGVQGPLPGLMHLHGGGMAILQAADESAAGWRAAGRPGLCGGRRGVPELGGSPRAASVPGRPRRLRQCLGLDA
jgi:acetyl esterase/lipase